MKEFGRLVIEISSLKSELFGATIKNLVDCLAGIDQRGIVADSFDDGIDASIFELDPSVCQAVLGFKDSDAVGGAGVPGVGVAEDEDGVADRPGVDVVSDLLEVCCTCDFVA